MGQPQVIEFEQHDEDEARLPKTGVVDIDWKEPDDVADLKNYLWENKGYKRRVEEQAIRNIAYVLGDQHFRLNRRTMVMEPDRTRPDWSIQLTYNVTLANLLRKLARIQGADVEWGSAPLTDDEPDKVVARLQRDLAKHYYSRGFKMPQQLVRAEMLAMMTKTCFIECNWNPLGGDKRIIRPEDFAPLDPMTGLPDIEQAFVMFGREFGAKALERGWKTQFTGDMMLEVFPLFELITYPFTELSFDRMFIKMRTRLRHITQAARIAGMEVDELREHMGERSTANPEDQPWQDKLTSQQWGTATYAEMTSATTSKHGVTGSPDDEMVYCHDLYLEPWYDPENYPDGWTGLVINDFCVPSSLKAIPTPNKRAPYWAITEIPVEGSLYGTCTVDQMRSGQDDLNDLMSQAANYRRRQVAPTIIHFGGFAAGVKKPFNNQPGAVLEIDDPARMPRILERPDLPSDYERTLTSTMRLLDAISGSGDVDRGQTNLTKASSGKAIQSLQAANDSLVSPMVKQIRNTVSEIGEFAMECLQEFMVDDKITEIIGENNKSELKIWNREMLRPSTWGQPGIRTAMVRVTGDGGLPTSREEILEYIKLFTEMQYFIPGRDDEKVWKLLGVGEIKSAMDADRVDSVAECLAIEAFRKGQIPPAPRETSDYRTRLNILGKWINNDDDYLETVNRFPMLVQPINERLEALKQGMYDREAEKQYLQVMADIRMRNKYLARGLQASAQSDGAISPEMIQAAFGAPLGMQAGMQQQGGGPPQE